MAAFAYRICALLLSPLVLVAVLEAQKLRRKAWEDKQKELDRLNSDSRTKNNWERAKLDKR